MYNAKTIGLFSNLLLYTGHLFMEDYIIHTDDFSLTQVEFLLRLLVAGGIGFLVGLEREHKAGKLTLHGWVYDLYGVDLLVYDVDREEFVSQKQNA